MPWNSAAPIARLRCGIRLLDHHPLNQDQPTCPCNNEPSTSKHVVLECPLWTNERKTLTADGTSTWDKITSDKMEPRVLLEFMILTGITKQQRIMTDLVDSRSADMELGMDI